ncbi:hypothetical protein BJX68DRAFT_237927, partial [Aspergillus pseudodeflectus]
MAVTAVFGSTFLVRGPLVPGFLPLATWRRLWGRSSQSIRELSERHLRTNHNSVIYQGFSWNRVLRLSRSLFPIGFPLEVVLFRCLVGETAMPSRVSH